MVQSSAITCATTCPCGELWLVEGCPHMDLLLPLHQPHLATWASCDTSCAISCGTRLIIYSSKKCYCSYLIKLLTKYQNHTSVVSKPYLTVRVKTCTKQHNIKIKRILKQIIQRQKNGRRRVHFAASTACQPSTSST